LKISRAWIVSTAKRNVQSYMVSDRAERPPKPMARMNSGDHCTTCNVETTPMSVGRVSLSPAVIASRAILHGRRLGTWHLTPKWQPSSQAGSNVSKHESFPPTGDPSDTSTAATASSTACGTMGYLCFDMPGRSMSLRHVWRMYEIAVVTCPGYVS